jgi:excisionase family DNA binding protein
MEKATVTVEEAAQLLGIGRATAYRAARHGSLPTIRIGRRLLVPKEALQELLRNSPRKLGAQGVRAGTPEVVRGCRLRDGMTEKAGRSDRALC